MIVRLHTWRFGIEQTIELHGLSYVYDEGAHDLFIARPVFQYPVEPGTEPDPTHHYPGYQSMWTIVAGDHFDVLHCPAGCGVPEHHNTDPFGDAVETGR